MITSRTKEELNLIRASGKILKGCLEIVESHVKPGVSTAFLNDVAHKFIVAHNAEPSFLGYNDFPKSICTSVNSEVVHGIPSEKVILKEGDIVGVDIGVTYKGFVTDAARTFAVGKISKQAEDLIETTRLSFFESLKGIKAGVCVNQIGANIESFVKTRGKYGIVRALSGHGVGAKLHEPPVIYNFKTFGKTEELPLNCVLAIEPMINMGGHGVVMLRDGWTIRTADGKFSAHYENTVIVGAEACEIATE